MSNKVQQAKELFGDFSGHLLDQEYEVDLDHLTDEDDGVLFAFGRLDTLIADNGDRLEFDDDCAPVICSNHDGKQLYIIGGDYELDGFSGPVPLLGVEYSTYRDNNFEQYRHEFDKSDLPMLDYHSDDDELEIFDGKYTFTDKGIENM